MNHLPLEIQHTIFIKLDLEDRLRCMLICRGWYDILNRYSLLYSVDITCSQFPQFKDMLERLPYRATQVEKLTMNVDPKSTSDKRKLCNMFPNLRELVLDTGFDMNTTIDYMAMQFQFVNSTSKLEIISDIGDCHLTRQLAISNQLSLLTTLELSFGNIPYSVCLQIILQLMNMPVLKNLRLIELKCELMDLEVLHSNLPSVQYLNLEEPYLISGENPHDVQPATLITEIDLDLEDVDESDTHIQFYQYSIKKYPFINILRYSDLALANYGEDDLREVFNDGVFPFLQKFGSKLDTFNFQNHCSGLGVFNKFDDYGVKLKELEINSNDPNVLFLEDLIQSKQPKYIQKLIVRDDIIPRPMHMMYQMEVLQILCIDYTSYGTFRDATDNTVNFSQLIDACPPTLSSLTTYGVDFTFNESTSSITSITHLNIDSTNLTPDLAKVIETSFPKLSTLHLRGSIVSKLIIKLPNHRLDDVKISFKYNSTQSNELLTETTSDDTIQCYTLKRINTNDSDTVFYIHDEDNSVSKDDDSLLLKLTCTHVKKMRFQRYRPLIVH